MTEPAPEYVAARRTLLDALDALGTHWARTARASYSSAPKLSMCTGAGTLTIPPMTTDADLTIDADLLADNPEIALTMQAAGFAASQPGHWENPQGIAVDIMVAPHQSNRPAGSRAADLAPHAKSVARIGPGLAPSTHRQQPSPHHCPGRKRSTQSRNPTRRPCRAPGGQNHQDQRSSR